MANSAGVRDHLFCLGINLPRDPRGRARGPAIPAGSYAVFRGWLDPVCLDQASREKPHSCQQEWRDLAHARSEEHTSELQSHSDLVCRLLLEKKKNTAR